MLTETKSPQRRRRGGWAAQPKHPRPNRKLIELRINAGLSPNYLALRAGVSRDSVRSAEAGRRVSPRIQLQIAEVFGLKPLDIWQLEDQL